MGGFWEGATRGLRSGPDIATILRQKRVDAELAKRTELHGRQVDLQEKRFEEEKRIKGIAENWKKAGHLLGGASAAHQSGNKAERNSAMLQLNTLMPNGMKSIKIGVTAQPGEDTIPTDITTENYLHMQDENGKDIFMLWDDREAEKLMKTAHGYIQEDQFYKDSMVGEEEAQKKSIESLQNAKPLHDDAGNISGYSIVEYDAYNGANQVNLTTEQWNERMGLPKDHVPMAQTTTQAQLKEVIQKGKKAELLADEASISLDKAAKDPQRLKDHFENEKLTLADRLNKQQPTIENEKDPAKKAQMNAEYEKGRSRLQFLERMGGFSEQLTAKELGGITKSLRSIWTDMPDEQQASYESFDGFFEEAFGELATLMRGEKKKSLLSSMLAMGPDKGKDEKTAGAGKVDPMAYVTPPTIYPVKKKTKPTAPTLSSVFAGS